MSWPWVKKMPTLGPWEPQFPKQGFSIFSGVCFFFVFLFFFFVFVCWCSFCCVVCVFFDLFEYIFLVGGFCLLGYVKICWFSFCFFCMPSWVKTKTLLSPSVVNRTNLFLVYFSFYLYQANFWGTVF